MANSKRSGEKEQFWRLVLDEHTNSGLSVRAFCRREAITEASFYFWRRKLAASDAKSDLQPNSPQLVPVRIVDSMATQSGDDISPRELGVVEISMPGGFTLRAGSETDTERIAAWNGFRASK